MFPPSRAPEDVELVAGHNSQSLYGRIPLSIDRGLPKLMAQFVLK